MINDYTSISMKPRPSLPQLQQDVHGEDISEATERSHLLYTTQLSRSSHATKRLALSRGDIRPHLEPYDDFDVFQNGQRHRRLRPSLDEKPLYEGASLSECFSPLPTWARKTIPIAVIATMVVSYSTILLWVLLPKLRLMNVRAVEVGDQVVLPIVERSWAAYTPYYTVEPYEQPPVDCKVTQVNIIQRHGARYPTSGSAPLIRSAVAKLKSVNQYTDRRLDFLKNYTYALGVADLVAFGALEAQRAGHIAYDRYSNIVSHDKMPFVRTSGGQRVIDSAQNWTSGFSAASGRVYEPHVSVILDEGDGKNNTLDDNMCPNAAAPDEYTATWTNIFGPPIADRLNAQAPGAGITAKDVPNLMALCAFETVATSSLSPFCQLFSPEEFAQYEYLGDVEKYYNTGHGQPLGRIQGVGYVNELIARLTNTPLQDNTQTNSTLDSSPLTFPLNQTLYADFSHDNQMVAIYAALGLFRQRRNLDPTKPDPMRTWVASRLTPFSARMVTERLECDGHQKRDDDLEESTTSKKRRGDYVRIFVNDAIQPLGFCGGDHDQLCELGKFVKSQGYARRGGDGDFEKCFD